MAVEARRHSYTMKRVMHQECEPTPMCVLDRDEVATTAAAVIGAIRRIERARSCGAYLFVSPDMRVYVVSEERSCSQRFYREHLTWCVGYYRDRPVKGAKVAPFPLDLDDLIADLTDHLKDLAHAS